MHKNTAVDSQRASVDVIASKKRHFFSAGISSTVFTLLNIGAKKSSLTTFFLDTFSFSNEQEKHGLSESIERDPIRSRKSLRNSIVVATLYRFLYRRQGRRSIFDVFLIRCVIKILGLDNPWVIRSLYLTPKSSNRSFETLRNQSIRTLNSVFTLETLFTSSSETFQTKVTVFSDGLFRLVDGKLSTSDQSLSNSKLFVAGLSSRLIRLKRSSNLVLLRRTKNLDVLEIGGVVCNLTSRCASNYWHSLIEDVGRYVWYLERNGSSSFDKIIISKNMSPAAVQALRMLAPEKEIVQLGTDSMVETAQMISPMGMISLYDEPTLNINHTFQVQNDYILNLRNWLLKLPSLTPNLSRECIYITRNSPVRRLQSEEELIFQLESEGVEIFDFSTLSFENQFEVIRSAKKIIGVAGAAWANIVMASTETAFLSIVGVDAANWDLHAKIAQFCGVPYQQLVVQQERSKALFYSDYMHSDLILSKNDLKDILDWAKSS